MDDGTNILTSFVTRRVVLPAQRAAMEALPRLRASVAQGRGADLYAVLGVSRTATPAEARRAISQKRVTAIPAQQPRKAIATVQALQMRTLLTPQFFPNQRLSKMLIPDSMKDGASMKVNGSFRQWPRGVAFLWNA